MLKKTYESPLTKNSKII